MPEDLKLGRPHFYTQAVQDNSRSVKEGRPIFDEIEMVKISHPGDRLHNWTGPVTEKHFIRGKHYDATELFPDDYAAFKKGGLRASHGTPLEEWPNPGMTKGRVAELKAMDILSVEELGNIPDNVLPKMGMGARELRDAAKAYITTAKDGAANAKMAAELAQLRAMVEQLTAGAAPTFETFSPGFPPEPKDINDCTDDELKAYIKRETGQAPRGTPSRETLIAKAAEVARAAV